MGSMISGDSLMPPILTRVAVAGDSKDTSQRGYDCWGWRFLTFSRKLVC